MIPRATPTLAHNCSMNSTNPEPIPRGIEVLVKKASVDAQFCERLLDQRGDAAAEIGLELDPAERAMLNAIPRQQLAQLIQQTVVPVEQRRVFLGRAAAAMLAVLGVTFVGSFCTLGVQPDRIETLGIQPDRPARGSAPPLPQPPGTNQPMQEPDPNIFPSSRGTRPDRP
jgi:hypothetical protein